jgi:exopolysaccharide biosynthesis protein
MNILPTCQKKNVIIFLSIIISFLAVACGETKYSQCEQIITIANSVAQKTHQLIDINTSHKIEIKTWIKAAELMAKAAQQLEALPIKDAELINYQADLAKVYRTNSQVTYDMIQAWEDKDIVAAQAAQTEAKTAGELERKLGDGINDYCLNK